MVIWANHNMRAAIRSMENVCKKIMVEKSVANIEEEIASVNDIFNLLDYHELSEAEKKYLVA